MAPRCLLLRCCCGAPLRDQQVRDKDLHDLHDDRGERPERVPPTSKCTASCLLQPEQSYLSEPLPSCRKLLRKRAGPSKVVLFPDEAWARNATSSYWTLTPVWWSRSRCVVVEVSGTRRTRTRARMEESSNGNIHIVGSFKTEVDPNFKLCLTARVSAADFNMGYCMTGTLERGCKRTNSFQITHFAVIRRHEVT